MHLKKTLIWLLFEKNYFTRKKKVFTYLLMSNSRKVLKKKIKENDFQIFSFTIKI